MNVYHVTEVHLPHTVMLKAEAFRNDDGPLCHICITVITFGLIYFAWLLHIVT